MIGVDDKITDMFMHYMWDDCRFKILKCLMRFGCFWDLGSQTTGEFFSAVNLSHNDNLR